MSDQVGQKVDVTEKECQHNARHVGSTQLVEVSSFQRTRVGSVSGACVCFCFQQSVLLFCISDSFGFRHPSLSQQCVHRSLLFCQTTYVFRIMVGFCTARMNPIASLSFQDPKDGVPPPRYGWNRCNAQAECRTMQLSDTRFFATAILELFCYSAQTARSRFI